MLKRSASALILPLALASCAPSMTAPNASTVDGLFLQAATGDNLFEIQSSQLALTKTNTPAVRAYAQRMIDHHVPAQDQVAALAATRRVPLPTALPPELQIKLNTLGTLSGAAFDTAYLNEQVLSHQLALSVGLNERSAGRDAQVVALAAGLQPIIAGHLQDALALGGAAPSAPPAPASLGSHTH
ncbi:DUF4142 domain-containing protein [Deinococcus aestuarii]|uniref:DUF4142 domain-containing protein n=1 Tax=Deinococcus aestuarii TaxID=2774531 RepID=UPI001C0C27E3|nr:DUF4142 domain-containing protein [Deinococcus aestuarii]